MKRAVSCYLIILVLSLFFQGCKKDKGDPPVLPPYESMIIDFRNFTAPKKSDTRLPEQKGVNNSNWEYAAEVAGKWEIMINSALAVPIASYKTASDFNPGYLAEKTWQWSYNFSVAGVSYKARLVGQIRSTDINWQMYITLEGTGGYDDFLWFEGTNDIEGSSGVWKFRQSSATPVELFETKWRITETSVTDVEYKYVKSGSFNGSYIKYGLKSGELNAGYDIHIFDNMLVRFSDVLMEWNTSAGNGRVKSADYLIGEWYCWNSNKINVLCTK